MTLRDSLKLGGAALLALAALFLGFRFGGRKHEIQPQTVLILDDFTEVSGLAYWAPKGTLIAVSDLGQIGEITPEGQILRSRTYAEYDFEDVALCADGQTAWIVDERGSRVAVVRLEDFELLESFPLPRSPGLTNRSYEGITAPIGDKGCWLLKEESPPSIIELTPDRQLGMATILNCRSATSIMQGMTPQELIVLSRERGLTRVDMNSGKLDAWLPLATGFAEGMALVEGKGLFIAIDRLVGKLLVFPEFSTPRALSEAISRAR